MNAEDEKLFGIDKLNIKIKYSSNNPCRLFCRIQTVHKDTNPRYYDLINEFKKNTNCPVLVNTSFNVRVNLLLAQLMMHLITLWELI